MHQAALDRKLELGQVRARAPESDS